MIDIRIHGRGGQGVVAASEILAIAFFKDGKKTQAFPNFGVERSGAPIQSFVRVSEEEILSREHIYHPDILIVQDDSLVVGSGIFTGIKKNTKIIINSKKNQSDLFAKIKKEPGVPANFKPENIIVIDASQIAWEVFNRNIVNTTILGALVRIPGLLRLEAVIAAIKEKFQHKGQVIIDKNILAIERAYNLNYLK